MLETIGPVWDGNEVWLVVAGGATFAAFPAWYATMFSGFYLALLLVLVCLIVRAVSFEWRERSDEPALADAWRWANTVGSVGAPFVWGVALANLLHGVPLDSDGNFSRQRPRPLQRVHGPRRARGRRALRPARRDLPHPAHHRRPVRAGGRGRAAAVRCRPRSSSRRSSPATVAVGVDRNDRDVFPPVLPAALGVAALVLAVVLVLRRAQRLGVRRDGGRDRALGGDALHRPLSARARLAPRRSPTASRSSGAAAGALRAERDHGRRPRSACRSCCSTRAGRTTSSARASAASRPVSRSVARPQWPARRRAEGRARPRPAPRPPHAVRPPAPVVDSALGVATTAFVAAPGDAAREDRRRGLRGRCRSADLRGDVVALALAFAGRGALAWGMEVAGRRAAASVLSELRLGARRAPPGDAADRGRRRRSPARSPRPRCRASSALEAYFARYLPQVVLASIVPFAVVAWVATVDLESAARDARSRCRSCRSSCG